MSSIEVLSAVHGIAPRSDDLLRLGTDLEKGRISQDTYDVQIEHETAAWIALQKEAGIDIIENGKLRWQDHLRPIVKATQGFAADVDNAPVTRWFESNRFYRQPVIIGELRAKPDDLQRELGESAENISFPAPYTFAQLCVNQAPHIEVGDNILNLYVQLLSYLQSAGTKRIMLEEIAVPNLLNIGPTADVILLARTFPDLNIAYFYNDQSSSIIPPNSQANLGLGVNTGSLTHLRFIPPPFWPRLARREVWQQVIKAGTTVQDPLSVKDWPVDILRALRPARLILTHDTDLELLPRIYANEKIKRLGEFALQLRHYLVEEGL